ncbi:MULTISPECIES: hypothetical protein [Sorangium]|uniref:hypothetical protein n=1 Tax=Sorangium TaxID=39643 RepID=UPI00101A8F35|nr:MULTISPECIES: hypothetical protein [Sorangium]
MSRASRGEGAERRATGAGRAYGGAPRRSIAPPGARRLQALPEVFDLWADGIDLVVFEELGAGAAALHLDDPRRARTAGPLRSRCLRGCPRKRGRTPLGAKDV